MAPAVTCCGWRSSGVYTGPAQPPRARSARHDDPSRRMLESGHLHQRPVAVQRGHELDEGEEAHGLEEVAGHVEAVGLEPVALLVGGGENHHGGGVEAGIAAQLVAEL